MLLIWRGFEQKAKAMGENVKVFESRKKIGRRDREISFTEELLENER